MIMNLSRAFVHLFLKPFPTPRSHVGIPLAQDGKAKPNANTRTLRPDKCLVAKSLDSSLRPFALRNMESTAITTRDLKAGTEARFWGVSLVFRCRGGGGLSHCPSLALIRRERRRSFFRAPVRWTELFGPGLRGRPDQVKLKGPRVVAFGQPNVFPDGKQ